MTTQQKLERVTAQLNNPDMKTIIVWVVDTSVTMFAVDRVPVSILSTETLEEIVSTYSSHFYEIAQNKDIGKMMDAFGQIALSLCGRMYPETVAQNKNLLIVISEQSDDMSVNVIGLQDSEVLQCLDTNGDITLHSMSNSSVNSL